jgi:hypothetical protein
MFFKNLFKSIYLVIAFLIFASNELLAENIKVFYSGFSYLGNKKSEFIGMPYTEKIINQKFSNQKNLNQLLTENLKQIKPKNFEISFDLADLSKNETIIMSIGLIKENYRFEYNDFSKSYNNNIELFFQILFYDFKERKLIAAIPLYGEINFITENKINNDEIIQYIKQFYQDELIDENGQKIGFLSQTNKVLENFIIKEKYFNRIGITKVTIEESAKNEIPKQYLDNLDDLKTFFAQSFSSVLSYNQGVSIVPYIEGVAIGGMMKQKFINSSEIYQIQLPKPDYNIELTISNFKKGIAQTSDVSELWQYGSAVNIYIYEPTLQKIYMNQRLRRIASIKRALGTDINHWGKFYFNTQMLFQEFAINLTKQDNKWISESVDSKNFKEELELINQLLEKVK